MLDLPHGFSYKILSREGTVASGRPPVPSRFDGMGAFPDRHGGSRLVRNHECSPTSTIKVVAPPERTYDPGGAGGTSTLVVDRHNNTSKEYVSLGGTAINCSGGPTRGAPGSPARRPNSRPATPGTPRTTASSSRSTRTTTAATSIRPR